MRPALLPRVLDHHAHAVPAIVIVEIAHHPHAGMIHLNDGGDALGRAEPEHRNLGRRRHGITVERDDTKGVAGQGEAADLASTGIQYMEQDALALLDPERIADARAFCR